MSKVADREKIKFRFAVDRFGIREGGEPLRIEYARQAVRALTYWGETVDKLFGGTSAAMEAAAQARLLPRHPSWDATSDAVNRVRTWLGSGYPQSVTLEPQPGASEVEARVVAQSTAGQIVDAKTQDAVEELRLYLQALEAWASTFQAGVWAASLAATGSIEDEPIARMLQGLKSIAAVYEFDNTRQPEGILREFAALLPDSDSAAVAMRSSFPALSSAIESGRRAMQRVALSEFADEPDLLYNWLKDFRQTTEKYPNASHAPIRDSWLLIEDAYWGQWTWPTMGAVSRASTSPAVSALDLIYTARYGGVPILHWRGGNPSICQWSRILELASQRRRPALINAARTGLSNLGFEESTKPQLKEDSTGDERPAGLEILPIALISPSSERSKAWAWRPDPEVRAFALMPRELAQHDEAALRFDKHLIVDHQDVTDQADVILQTVHRDQRWAALLDFIEITDGSMSEVGDNADRMRLAPWRRAYFGFDGKGDFGRYVPKPRNMDELVEKIRQQYPDWFPPDPSKRPPLWRRIWDDIRLTELVFRRGVARAARWGRLLKRKLIQRR